MEAPAVEHAEPLDAKEANRQKFRRFYALNAEDVRRRVRERYWLLNHGVTDAMLLPPLRKYVKSHNVTNSV